MLATTMPLVLDTLPEEVTRMAALTMHPQPRRERRMTWDK